MHKDRSKGGMESHLKAIRPAATMAGKPRPGLQLRLHCQAAPFTTQASPAKKTINLSPKPVHPTAAPVLPGLSESRVNLTGAPALLQCGANLAAAPALLQHQACHIRAVRVHSPGSQVASGRGPHAGIQGQAAGSRQQAPGTRQQAGGREVEENAEAKLKAIFHTNRCENHCTVLLFC